MASNTAKVRLIRQRKRTKTNRTARAARARDGSTPKFSIHGGATAVEGGQSKAEAAAE